MLGILLLILKIILIIIGIVFGIVLLILGILLFNFCRFEAVGIKNNNISVKAKFKWFFGLVRGSYEVENDRVVYSVYIPFGICNIKYDSEENNINIDSAEENICNSDKINNKTIANIEKNSKIDNIVKKIEAFFAKIKGFINYIIEKINFVKKIDEKYCIKSLLYATIKLLKKIIKNIGFKKLDINGIIGFDDPSQTGKVLGAVSAFEGVLPFSINLSGNFESEELTGDFNIKGRTNLWLILFPIVKYVLTKPVWPVVKDYWRGELNE